MSRIPGLQNTTSTSVTVGSSSTTVLAATTNREYVAIVNDSDESIYLNISGLPAEMNKGIRLNANGGAWEATWPRIPFGDITAICLSGGKNLCVTEGA